VPNLTAIVTTFNEATHIAACLAGLRFADEMLVVDSFSTDGTPEIARECGARVLQHEYLSPADQKNWVIPQAANEWVLIVDADERVTEKLGEEIGRTIASPQACDGYEMKRRSFFLGHEIRYSGWQHDWVLRLFRKDSGRYLERRIHDRIAVAGTVGRLKGRLIHYSYRSLDDYWRKLRWYAEWSGAKARRRGAHISSLHLMLHPPLRFLKAYLMQGGFLDGMPGLVVSLLTAVYAAAKDVHIWESAAGGEGDLPPGKGTRG